MKIAVIGSGSMGSIYSGLLSQKNEVYLVSRNKVVIDTIKERGIKIEYEENLNYYYPKIVSDTDYIGTVDLIILFVKSLASKQALEDNKNLIGPHTKIMTLQNGAGHEELLLEFVSKEQIIIGTTEDNGQVLGPGHIKRGGSGITNIGMVVKDDEQYLEKVQNAFESSGLKVNIYDNIQQLIWDKLFTNTSLSSITAILQADMGFIAENKYAWNLTKGLIEEAINVANSKGLKFDEKEIIERVYTTSINNPKGFTSIRADILNGRKTEVDTISGAVLKEAKRLKIKVPLHEFVVDTIHAMEDLNIKNKINSIKQG